MAKVKRTRTVFLDTQVFDVAGLDLSHPNFMVLEGHVASGEVAVISTSVTVGEIEAHLKRAARAAQEGLRKVKNDHAVLLYSKRSPLAELFNKKKLTLIGDELEEELLEQWAKWVKAKKVRVLEVKDVDVEDVFRLYFEGRPPFGTGDKKAEFPDAFALEALLFWCMDEKQHVYVVTGDKKIGEFCRPYKDYLTHIERLSAFLELVPDATLVASLKTGVTAKLDDLKEAVSEAFIDNGLVVLGAEGQVDTIDVSEVEVDDVYIVEAGKGQALAEVDCRVSFTAEVEYEEPDSGVYDKESGTVYYADVASLNLEEELPRKAIVSLKYDPKNPTKIEVDSVRFKDWLGGYVDIEKHLYPDHH